VLIEILTIVKYLQTVFLRKNKDLALSIESKDKTLNGIRNLFHLNFELMLRDMDGTYLFLIYAKPLISEYCKYVLTVELINEDSP